jgi:site-specific DNA recombinase
MDSKTILPHDPLKPAVIFARVSTERQGESSLPTQTAACKEKLAQSGYLATRIIAIDFSSLDLYASPDFQELRRLIRDHEIEAVCVYDRDRLEAKGLQRLLFLSELKEAGVELVVCHGAPVIDGPEGQIVELALAIGKERQVLRARQGSRDGLRDRVALRHRPVTYHKVYGYQWDKLNNRLVPDDHHVNVEFIYAKLSEGLGYAKVINALSARGIPSPSGQLTWNTTAISNIVRNPIYAGRYFGLKKSAVAPKTRHGNTYGNSSVRLKPLTEAVYVPEIEIINPPITWEQRGRILEQVLMHQKLAQRNAKRNYLLRSRVFCAEHIGKGGEHRRYHGRPGRNGKWWYVCPVGGCAHANINGPDIERLVIDILDHWFNKQKEEFYQSLVKHNDPEQLREQLTKDLRKLGVESEKLINKSADLEDARLSGRIDDTEVYDRLRLQYTARRRGIKDTQDHLLSQIAVIGQQEEAVKTVMNLHDRISSNMHRMSEDYHAGRNKAEAFTFFREVLDTLDIGAWVGPQGDGVVKFIRADEGQVAHVENNFKGLPVCITVIAWMPVTHKMVDHIVSADPERG